MADDGKSTIQEALARDAQTGALVPFLGSGVSLKAMPATNDFEPTVKWLETQIWQALTPPLNDSPFTRLLYNNPKTGKKKALSLVDLSEIATWILGRCGVVEAVKLENFTKLRPTPAHRYIARMAREGWVLEVITTNYDTCLEQAYRATFLYQRKSLDGCPAVVVEGADYRELGRPARLDGVGTRGEQGLRIYKINGCAARWVAAREAYKPSGGKAASGGQTAYQAACELILLADPQLAAPGTPWKEDLLRDRMRSRRLVYSGFGADEGQIRYTQLAVDKEERPVDATHANDRPYPGPIVHVYGSQPSFHQLQLLPQLNDKPDIRGIISGISGWETSVSDTLSADDFWRIVYRYAAVFAIEHHLMDSAGAFRRRLARAGHPIAIPVIEELVKWLKEAIPAGGWDPFHEVAVAANGNSSLKLHAILHAARGHPQPAATTAPWQYYRPLADDNDVLCCLLYLIHMSKFPADEPDIACNKAILPLHWRGSQWQTLIIDTDRARQATWQVTGISLEQSPRLAVDLGSAIRDSVRDSVRVEVTTTDDHTILRQVPCLALTELLPSSYPQTSAFQSMRR